MKKKYYLMGIMLLAGLSSQAQTGWLATTRLPDNVKNTIVRHYLDEQSISYIQTGNRCYFAWSDNQNFIQLVQIDCDYEVKDFEIIEDTVCFCGAYGNNGFAGWFSIPDLMAGTDDYHIYHSFNTQYPNYLNPSSPIDSPVTVFNDLTIFDNPEDQMRRVHVALVGKNDKEFVCVEEMKGFFSTNNWTYTTGAPDGEVNNTMDHVVNTDNYIVACGTMSDGVSTGMRVFPKTAMFTPYPMLGDIIHRYTSSTSTPCDYPVGRFKMTAMNGDTVATTSLFTENTAVVRGFVTHIFDVADAIVAPIGSYCTDHRLVYDTMTPGNFDVNSITYSNVTRILANLVESPTIGRSLMGEVRYPFTGIVEYFTKTGYYFYNHDNYFSETGYIAMGKNESTPNELAIFVRPLLRVDIPDCGSGGTAPTDTNNFALKNEDVRLYQYNDTFRFNKLPPLGQQEFHLRIICTEQ